MPNRPIPITYVGMQIKYDVDGNITELVIIWPDGRQFEVDQLLDVKPTITVGSGFGNRYKCMVRNKEVSLYNDTVEGKWYVKH